VKVALSCVSQTSSGTIADRSRMTPEKRISRA
jgi:hypothetical protein